MNFKNKFMNFKNKFTFLSCTHSMTTLKEKIAVYTEKAQEKAARVNHTLVLEKSSFEKKKSKIVFFCKTCNKESLPTSLGTYLHNKNCCPFCENRRCGWHKMPETLEEQANYLAKSSFVKTSGKSMLGKKGPANPNWRGGKRAEHEASPEWARAVATNFSHKCFLTGKRDDCVAHHLYSKNKYPQHRNEVKNGVYILRDIHVHFHREYGLGNNTPKQFEEFCDRFYPSIKDFPWKDINTVLKVDSIDDYKHQMEVGRIFHKNLFLARIKDKNHVVISYDEGDYKNKHSRVIVGCNCHKDQGPFRIKVGNYMRNVTGLPCCNPANKNFKMIPPEGEICVDWAPKKT